MFRLFPNAALPGGHPPPRVRPAVPAMPPALVEPPAELSKYVHRLPRASTATPTLPVHPWLRAVMHSESTEPEPVAQVPAAPSSQKVWGPVHWTLLHTLAEKVIDDEAFGRCREYLVAMVQQICSILPCPRCVSHAREYLAQVQWLRIRTRADWIEFLWLFHNFVNWRTKQSTEPREVLSAYAARSTAEVIRAYFTMIQKPTTFAYHTNLNHGMVRTTTIQQIRVLMAKCHDCLHQ